MHLSLFGSQRGVVSEGGTRAGCEEGRVEGAGHVRAHLEVLYKKPVPAAIPPAWTAWLVTLWHNAMPPHPLPALPLGACSGHKNIRRLKSFVCFFFFNYDYKSNFHFVSSKCYMCIILTCDWREDNRFRMSSSLLLQCIVCNSKLVYVVWTLKSMQKSL